MSDSVPADLAIKARWILPIEPAGQLLEDHVLLVRAGRITGLVSAAQYSPAAAATVIERPAHVLIPGLVNAHTHAAMTLLRGAGSGLQLDDWLRQRIWPLERHLVDEQFVADGTALAMAEMLLGGTTCFADMYYYPEVAAAAAARMGMRASIGLPVLEQPTAWARDVDEYLARSLELGDRYRNDPLVGTHFALHSPAVTSDATLARLRTLADQLQSPVMIHLLESPAERAREQRRHGRGPLQRLQAAGLVNDLLLAVHCVQAQAQEIEDLAAAGASVVHCPASNLKLASGIAPIVQMRRAGLSLALGTDGAASNDSLDLLGEARLAALLAAGVSGDAAALPPLEALAMATLGGARALGLGEQCGSIVPGKWADLACIRLAGPGVEPCHDVAEAVLHAAGRAAVSDTWVAGRHLVADGMLRHCDGVELGRRARAWQPKLVAALQSIAGQ